MKKILVTALFFCLVIGVSFGQGRNKEAMQQKIESMRIAYIAKQLDLKPEEAQKFWPIFNKYQAERKTLKGSYKTTKKGKEVSSEQAEAIISASFELKEKELELKRKYYAQLKSVLSPKQIVTLEKAERDFKETILKRAKERRKRKSGKAN